MGVIGRLRLMFGAIDSSAGWWEAGADIKSYLFFSDNDFDCVSVLCGGWCVVGIWDVANFKCGQKRFSDLFFFLFAGFAGVGGSWKKKLRFRRGLTFG